MRKTIRLLLIGIFITVYSATAYADTSFDKYIYDQAKNLNRTRLNVASYHVKRAEWDCDDFAREHPDLFYLDEGRESTWTNVNKLEEMQLGYAGSDKTIKKRIKQVDRQIERIVRKARRVSGKRSQVKIVNNELKKRIKYKKNKNKDNVYGALIQGKATCEGYSRAFAYCMDQLNIPCSYQTGKTKSGEGHIWNTVKIKGKTYIVDVTWNDTCHSNDYLLISKHPLRVRN